MRDPWNDSELVRRFHAQARTALPRAPLNSALCTAIARDRSLSSLLGHAPVAQQVPVLLLAAIHFLLLAEPDHRLADWYPNLRDAARDSDDPELAAELAAFVHDRTPAILHLLETRHVQTNEVGRCALLLPAFALLAAETGPLAHVDVGTSAGLTTLLPRFSYRYDDRRPVGDGDVLLECSTRGSGPTPTVIPAVACGRGIDLRPLDVTNDADARWLRACCWPDQSDRFARLSAAVEVARQHPPVVIDGDAIDLVAPTVAAVAGSGHPVVTTSWVLSYLAPGDRRSFVDRLDEVGSGRDLSWVFAESPAQTPELPHAPEWVDLHTTALTLVTWRSGERRERHLALCHPHGYWLHWR